MAKNTICLWYDKDAEAAARFYAETFPDSTVGAIHRAPSDYPSGKKGDVLIVEFKVAGVSCVGLNGGPTFKHNEAFSFQIATDDQPETDRYLGYGSNGTLDFAANVNFGPPGGGACDNLTYYEADRIHPTPTGENLLATIVDSYNLI